MNAPATLDSGRPATDDRGVPERNRAMQPTLIAAALLGAALAAPARAELALVVTDNKAVLRNGVVTIVPNAAADTLAIIDLAANPPKLKAEIAVPGSVVGPPVSVAMTPDGRLALVTANQKPDPADPSKAVNNNVLTVVDLAAEPPKVIATLQTGAAPAGLSISPDGTLALVANRAAGTVSAFRIQGGEVTASGTVTVGPPTSGVSHVAFLPDGKTALVTRDNDHTISVLKIDGATVTKTDRDLAPGQRPYGMAIAPNGAWAVVANIGRGLGDADTVSLIDLAREPYRVVDTITVGQTPEGIMTAPDNRHVAVTVMNGSNKPDASPFKGPGLVKMLRVENGRLALVGETRVGSWAQGAAFSADGRTLLVGNMVEKDVQVFRVGTDGALTDTGTRIAVGGGAAAMRSGLR